MLGMDEQMVVLRFHLDLLRFEFGDVESDPELLLASFVDDVIGMLQRHQVVRPTRAPRHQAVHVCPPKSVHVRRKFSHLIIHGRHGRSDEIKITAKVLMKSVEETLISVQQFVHDRLVAPLKRN